MLDTGVREAPRLIVICQRTAVIFDVAGNI